MEPFLTAALAGFGGKAAMRVGGQQLANSIANFVGMQSAELKLLGQLSRDLDRVKAAPFFTATRLLEDANKSRRTDEDRERLLHEARTYLTEALAVDSDPLRRSCAAVLLGGVWMALGYPEDAIERVREAHELAIAAARAVADSDPPPPGRVRTLLRLPRKHRPGAYRLGVRQSIGLLGVTLLRIETYEATEKAQRAERQLCGVHDFVSDLKSLRVSLGDEGDDIPDFSAGLVPSYRVLVPSAVHADGQFYALQYRQVSPEESAENTESDSVLSPERARLKITFLPDRRKKDSSV
ncbi:hypothetical protein [Streptomyces sp. NPDC002962]|uniref:hypothetical protein n=1 Tax=Streptomyces sp. NPDC002962 TaxID=3364674 RepID=UPI0036AE4071